MPISIQDLREKKNKLSQEARKLQDDHKERMPADVGEKFDALMNEAEEIDRAISAQQRVLDDRATDTVRAKKDGDPKVVEARRGVEVFLRKSASDRSPEEHALVRNTMSTTTGSQGGYTVPSQVSSDLIEVLKDYGAMRRVATRLVTSNGQTIAYPTTDGTAEVGEIVAQNASAAASDPTFGTVSLGAFKWSSKIVAIPFELLQDTTIDIISFVNGRLRDRLGRIQNTKFTIGAGTTEPTGLVTAATVGKTGTTGQTTTIIYDDLVDMADSVDVAYLSEGAMSWMFGQTLRKTLRKLKDSQGRPIWTPGYEGGITQNTPDMLMGYPVVINNDMPTPAANAKSLAFGQLGKYIVRDTMEVTLFRFEDSAYASKGQVGFLAWSRADGNLTDASGVRLYQNSAT